MFFDQNAYHLSGKKCKGYTLMEVLVAMVILTSMLMLGGMAINQGLRQYHGLVENGLNSWDYAKVIWIDKSFNSATDYYVHTRSTGWFPYFRGDQEGLSYVSLAPFAGNTPVVIWIVSESEKDGSRSLLYYELPVYAKTYEELDRNYVFGDYKRGKSFKIIDHAAAIEFGYYGFDIRDRRSDWHSRFDGRTMRNLPSLVKISYRHHDTQKGVLLLSMKVNSLIKTGYDELYPR
ncbi:MAG: prepilin-type N-terminal cleavage/methylation domain-containing protein [Syntrophales bacterium LBB04]|nr:prepilin-type N-terminal cleavage/methylation domain-containing protein [Syntrophales bacterium LBB04]